MKRRKKNAVKPTFVIVAIGVLLFIFLGYIREKHKYSDIFFDETIINNVDCSYLTIEEAKTSIQQKEQKYSIELLFKDNEVEEISASEIDYNIYNLQKELENIKEQQRNSIFLKGETYNLKNFTYDEEKLKIVLLSKKELQKDYMNEKSQIEYIYNPSTKLFETKQVAYYLDFDAVFDSVSKAIDEQLTLVPLENLYSNVDTSSTLSEMNSFISSEITYQLPNNSFYILDADTLSTWLVQEQDGKYFKNINVWNQHIEDFVTNHLEIETDCVTGCINKDNETPTGIFTLTYKEEDRILKGALLANGKREYESFVNYWMPFNGGIGLHDATWRSSFGGNIYISDGSHGCINLPLEAAKKLYSLITYDMPIIVYKSK